MSHWPEENAEGELERIGCLLRCVRILGDSRQSIFSHTLLYVLRRGRMKTVDIHPLIQRIHPGLCDDAVDRVIDGIHYGKKWKHLARSAQQHLKRKGLIDTDGEGWFLTPKGRTLSRRLVAPEQ